ncbi:conserved protein of unknown function (plasmid) [Rhodovastum atsumiense]|uniref:DUF3102 domain-containing protein n=1 Tax=Rhodovastum atsumiense TaxID=504468 RepID=A0A5M6IL20_9PROT|nr:hypothetical protein [Rhodovastum atsumiense]KAA5608268.1 hypothetical protein F1189_29865 [Rhodovastum atsumiense]CAH2605679.1 conserved protein of unknown function [Rhodovastum atsumiense]
MSLPKRLLIKPGQGSKTDKSAPPSFTDPVKEGDREENPGSLEQQNSAGNTPVVAAEVVATDVQVVGVVGLPDISDYRARRGLQSQMEANQLLRRTREILRPHIGDLGEEGLQALVSDIDAANRDYESAFDTLLDIGRKLNSIRRITGHGGYRALLAEGIVRIHETTASKLRLIAGAWDEGKIPPSLQPAVPKNLSGAYLIATLPADKIEPTMRALVQEGMLPNGPVREIQAAVKRYRDEEGRRHFGIRNEIARKKAQIAKLTAEITALETALAQLQVVSEEKEGNVADK